MSQTSVMDAQVAPELQLIRQHLAQEDLSGYLDLLPNVSKLVFIPHDEGLRHNRATPLPHKLELHLSHDGRYSLSTVVYLTLHKRKSPSVTFAVQKIATSPHQEDRIVEWELITGVDVHKVPMHHPFSIFQTGSTNDLRMLKALVKIYFLWAGHVTFQQVKVTTKSTFYKEVAGALMRLNAREQERLVDNGSQMGGDGTLDDNAIAAAPQDIRYDGGAADSVATAHAHFPTHNEDDHFTLTKGNYDTRSPSLYHRINEFLDELQPPTVSSPGPHEKKKKVAEDEESLEQRFELFKKRRDDYNRITSLLSQMELYKESLLRQRKNIEDTISEEFSAGEIFRFQSMENI
ncbi:hypothetical protein SLS60_006039 [Paraconiothyrium brasiliense]|uniref:Uncharacterized protein n=1 Tax=Paraconiothyrium brasiliense TaxID=300254 RepID=A0ABR3RFH8_9PLEO